MMMVAFGFFFLFLLVIFIVANDEDNFMPISRMVTISTINITILNMNIIVIIALKIEELFPSDKSQNAINLIDGRKLISYRNTSQCKY